MSEPRPDARRSVPPGTLRLGTVAGVDVLVRWSWLLVALLISIVLAPRIDQVAPGLDGLVYVAGLVFAILLYLSILLHEISHALMAKGFGLPVRSVTLHFLGGVTEIEEEAGTPWREFWISVVGPLASLAVAAGAWGLSFLAPEGLLHFACEALALANLVVGVLNLVPGMPLDGGRVLRAVVWGLTGSAYAGTVVSGWAGRLVAVLALFYPAVLAQVMDVEPTLVDYALAAIIAVFLWGGASATITNARLRRRIPALRARTLARRAVEVPDDLNLDAVVSRAREAEAGGIVVIDRFGRPSAVVSEQAVTATPEQRRPWLPVQSVARTLDDGLRLPADLEGEALVRAMQHHPASEYVLVEADGRVFGVLVTADVDAAFAETS